MSRLRNFDLVKAGGVLLAISLAATGCKKSASPAVLTPEQVPGAVENAFKEASPEIKDLANAVVTSLQNKEEPKAFDALQNLSNRPDLTPEQREAAMRAVIALNFQLAAAAAKGDKSAEEMLEKYRATK